MILDLTHTVRKPQHRFFQLRILISLIVLASIVALIAFALSLPRHKTHPLEQPYTVISTLPSVSAGAIRSQYPEAGGVHISPPGSPSAHLSRRAG